MDFLRRSTFLSFYSGGETRLAGVRALIDIRKLRKEGSRAEQVVKNVVDGKLRGGSLAFAPDENRPAFLIASLPSSKLTEDSSSKNNRVFP